MIRQGNVYWLDLGRPLGSEPGFVRPYVVLQNNVFNDSPIQTAVICGLTTNLRRSKSPGNVLLDVGEAGLPGRSVVNVTQLVTVDKALLTDPVGHLTAERVHAILAGVMDVLAPAVEGVG